MRSTSRLTLRPGALWRSVVCSTVCGIRLTVNSQPPSPRSATALTVRLTPSTAIEPLKARKRAGASGAATARSHDSPTRSKRATVPTPSTWPLTRWPSRRSPARSAFSRLTSPVRSSPLVAARLAAETSTRKRSRAAAIATTVMQAPAIAMLSPSAVDASSQPGGGATVSALPNAGESPSGSTLTIRPTALTMPVNMRRLSSPPTARAVTDASPRRGRSRVVCQGRRAQQQAQVVADASDVDERETECVVEPRERRKRGEAATVAEQLRRDVDEQLVDETGGEQRCVELLAGLDVQLVDLAPAEVGDHRREVDLAARRRRERDLGAVRFERATPRAVVDRRVDEHLSRRREDARGGRRLEARIDDHAQRLAHRLDEAHVEPRVVVAHGADARQHRSGALAPGVAVGARRRAGDPLARAVGERAAAVERNRDLHAQPRPAALHPGHEADVELARSGGRGVVPLDRDSGGSETRRAFAGDERIRVAQRDDDAADPGGDERVGARRRAAVV